MLIEAIKPENFTHFPELILCNFLTRVCKSSTHNLCVLPLQMCKVKCDWFLSTDVAEIVLLAQVRRHYFRRRQPTAGNTLRSQATNRSDIQVNLIDIQVNQSVDFHCS